MPASATFPRIVFSICLCFVAAATRAQEPAATATVSDPQAVQLLQRSQLALTGGNPLSDATLSGTARRIAGSDNQTGSGVLKAIKPSPPAPAAWT